MIRRVEQRLGYRPGATGEIHFVYPTAPLPSRHAKTPSSASSVSEGARKQVVKDAQVSADARTYL